MCIKGDSSLTKSRVSLKNLLKTWEEHDHRFLIECKILEQAELNKTVSEEIDINCETEELITSVLD